MALWAENRGKLELVNQYFSTLSPMAARIIEAKCKVVNSYTKESWSSMPVEEQEEVFNNHLIPNSVKARYKNHVSPEGLPEHYQSVFPRMIVNTGQEIIVSTEGENEEWKDEHSSPFAWETKSQMNLSLPEGRVKVPEKSHTLKTAKLTNVLVHQSTPVSKNGSLTTKRKPAENRSAMNLHTSGYLFTQQKETRQPAITRQLVTGKYHAEPVEMTNDVAVDVNAKYNLHSVERRSVTTKKSEHFNARASLTLEDDFQETESDNGTGAIHNLEEAMREEKMHNKQALSQQKKLESCSSSSETSVGETSGKEIEEAPLLKTKTTFLELEQDNNARKSGFDFLDNW